MNIHKHPIGEEGEHMDSSDCWCEPHEVSYEMLLYTEPGESTKVKEYRYIHRSTKHVMQEMAGRGNKYADE